MRGQQDLLQPETHDFKFFAEAAVNGWAKRWLELRYGIAECHHRCSEIIPVAMKKEALTLFVQRSRLFFLQWFLLCAACDAALIQQV